LTHYTLVSPKKHKQVKMLAQWLSRVYDKFNMADLTPEFFKELVASLPEEEPVNWDLLIVEEVDRVQAVVDDSINQKGKLAIELCRFNDNCMTAISYVRHMAVLQMFEKRGVLEAYYSADVEDRKNGWKVSMPDPAEEGCSFSASYTQIGEQPGHYKFQYHRDNRTDFEKANSSKPTAIPDPRAPKSSQKPKLLDKAKAKLRLP
jgi:hypothetical protein